MHGIKELKELMDLLLGVTNAILKAKEDGKIGVEDAKYLLDLLPLVGPSMDGVVQVPAELSDMTSDEAQELVAHVMASLMVTDLKAKAIVEQGLKTLICVYALVRVITKPE